MPEILKSKIATGVLAVLVGWLSLAAVNIYLQKEEVVQNSQNIQKKLADLEKNNADLEKEKTYIQDSNYLERQARLKMNYKLPGEQVVFVYPRTVSSQMETVNLRQASLANYEKWFYYLLGK